MIPGDRAVVGSGEALVSVFTAGGIKGSDARLVFSDVDGEFTDVSATCGMSSDGDDI